jgi:hypothetical protein
MEYHCKFPYRGWNTHDQREAQAREISARVRFVEFFSLSVDQNEMERGGRSMRNGSELEQENGESKRIAPRPGSGSAKLVPNQTHCSAPEVEGAGAGTMGR